MREQRTFEVLIRATDAQNNSHDAHVEYTTHAPDVEVAARELAVEMGKALGKQHIHPIEDDR